MPVSFVITDWSVCEFSYLDLSELIVCVVRNIIDLSREIATIMFSVNLFNPYYLHHHHQLRHRTPSGLSLCNQLLPHAGENYAFYKYTSGCYNQSGSYT